MKESIIGSSRTFNLIYLTIALAQMVSMYTFPAAGMIIKPLIVASLLGLYVWNARPQENKILMALIFALFGDIFLMFNGDLFFKLGLISFLLMQILYALDFSKYSERPDTRRKFYIGLTLLTAILFLGISFDHLGDLKIPVIFYAFALASMVILAILRKSQHISSPIAIGAFFFMISDLMLAYSKFIKMLPGSPLIIISTYCVAQFLIVNGLIFDAPDKNIAHQSN